MCNRLLALSLFGSWGVLLAGLPGCSRPAVVTSDRQPVEVDRRTKKAMPKVQWRFTGSVLSQPDPNREDKVYGADLTGTLIAIFPVTDQTVLQTNLTMKEEKYVKLETNTKLLPKEGTPVKLVIEVPAGK